MDTWPSTLPPLATEAGTSTDALYTPPQETQFDDGPSRVRRRRLYNETTRKVNMRLTRAQFLVFYEFTTVTLNGGAKRFEAPMRVRDGTIGNRVCRISGPVAERDEGPTSTLAFNLVVREW
jgi:hypothetical protein